MLSRSSYSRIKRVGLIHAVRRDTIHTKTFTLGKFFLSVVGRFRTGRPTPD
jgi:hypothetical protein